MVWRFLTLVGVVLAVATTAAAETEKYSKAVQDNCNQDYKNFCGEYGLESNALRDCMDRKCEKLKKACVQALVADGHVSQAEVDRRKQAGGR